MLSKTARLLKANKFTSSSLINKSIQTRAYADVTDGRQAAMEEAIQSILTNTNNEFEVTKELAFVASTVKSEEDFAHVMRLASRVVRINI